MTRGFAHSGVSLALLSILRICLGTIPNWQGLKASSLRPRPRSPCPETTGRWHLREKCLLVKALGELGKTGFNSWLRNGSYSQPWALAQNLCLSTKPPAPRETVLRMHLLIFGRRRARALFNGCTVWEAGQSSGWCLRLELYITPTNRSFYLLSHHLLYPMQSLHVFSISITSITCLFAQNLSLTL